MYFSLYMMRNGRNNAYFGSTAQSSFVGVEEFLHIYCSLEYKKEDDDFLKKDNCTTQP